MTDAGWAPADLVPIAGQRVLVSGGTTGIGRAIALRLARDGARVFVCGREPDHLADALTDLRAVGEADGIALDLADDDGVARFFAAGVDRLGGLDTVVINAAVGAEGLSDTSEADLKRAIAVDFSAYLLSARQAVDRLKDRGHIVLIGSMSAYVLGPGSTVYAGIKYGIQGFSRALRREMAPKGVRVSLVEPGLTDTDMIQKGADEKRAAVAADKMLLADDIAAAVHYLLTQPTRVNVQSITVAPRGVSEE